MQSFSSTYIISWKGVYETEIKMDSKVYIFYAYMRQEHSMPIILGADTPIKVLFCPI